MRPAMLLCFFIASLGLGCGGGDDDVIESLQRFRVIGMTSSAPDISFWNVLLGASEQVELGVVDFHPDDLLGERVGRTYEWTACFSVGAITKFACLDPDKALTHTSTDGRFDLELNAAALLALVPEILLEDTESEEETPNPVDDVPKAVEPCPEGSGTSCATDQDCAESLTCGDGHCAPGPPVSPIPLIIRVQITSESGEVVEAARTIQLRFLGDTNQNPALGTLKVGGGTVALQDTRDGCTPLGPFDSGIGEVPFEFVPDTLGFDTYAAYRFNECIEVDEADDAIISWYVSRGSLSNALGALDFPKNTLTLDDEAGPVRMYLSLRDGRNGLVTSCLDFELSARQMP
jgi:hypothetical protein